MFRSVGPRRHAASVLRSARRYEVNFPLSGFHDYDLALTSSSRGVKHCMPEAFDLRGATLVSYVLRVTAADKKY